MTFQRVLLLIYRDIWVSVMSKGKTFAVCKCIYEKNIFLRDHQLHVTYQNDEQFLRDYSNRIKGIDNALEEAREEVLRRATVASEVKDRRDLIKRDYKPLLPNIYTFDREYLSPEFLSLSESTKNVTQVGEGLFTFSVFTKVFCDQLLSELKHFKKQDIPHRQPNSMNKYGILLDDISGFTDFFDIFRVNYLQGIARKLFPGMHDIELDTQKGRVVWKTIDTQGVH